MELVADPDSKKRVRAMAQADAQAMAVDIPVVMEHVGPALNQGVEPSSAQGQEILDRILGPVTPTTRRAQLAGQLETFTDARVERYWQLLAVINGWPTPPAAVPGIEWLIAALRAEG